VLEISGEYMIAATGGQVVAHRLPAGAGLQRRRQRHVDRLRTAQAPAQQGQGDLGHDPGIAVGERADRRRPAGTPPTCRSNFDAKRRRPRSRLASHDASSWLAGEEDCIDTNKKTPRTECDHSDDSVRGRSRLDCASGQIPRPCVKGQGRPCSLPSIQDAKFLQYATMNYQSPGGFHTAVRSEWRIKARRNVADSVRRCVLEAMGARGSEVVVSRLSV
jgi:hypothetical protein